jgi:hypothetical protein
MSQQQIQSVQNGLVAMEAVYRQLLTILPSFDVTNRSVLPYGLKPHTRSVSWLVEQVITQQTKFNQVHLGLQNVNFDLPDTCLHDCEFDLNGQRFWVNIKVHNMAGKNSKNDIAAVEKLYLQYHANPNYNLIYACFGIHFDDINIRFDDSYLRLFSPQFLPLYVNPRNDKIQAFYHHETQLRSRTEFLRLLQTHSRSIAL